MHDHVLNLNDPAVGWWPICLEMAGLLAECDVPTDAMRLCRYLAACYPDASVCGLYVACCWAMSPAPSPTSEV
jgi:hypothetical protein